MQVTIGSEDLKANHMIQQVFQFPGELDKYASLVKLLEQEMDGSRLLVQRFLEKYVDFLRTHTSTLRAPEIFEMLGQR